MGVTPTKTAVATFAFPFAAFALELSLWPQ
jgi:hypothetical protein